MTEAATRAAPGAGTRCLTVIAGPRRYDVVVDEYLLVEEVLDLVFPGSHLLAVTMAGAPLPLHQTVVEAGLETGSMILTTSARTPVAGPRIRSATAVQLPGAAPGESPVQPAVANAGSRSILVPAGAGESSLAPAGSSSRGQLGGPAAPLTGGRAAARIRQRRAPRPPSPAESRDASRNTLVLATMVLAALAVVAFTRTLGQGSPWALAAGLILFVTGLSVAQFPTADRFARMAAPVLGLAGGAVGLGAYTEGVLVPVIGACATGAVVALAGRETHGPDRYIPRVWLGFLAAIGTISLVALAGDAPVTGVAIILLGIVVPLARVVPDLVLDVDDDVLLDIDRLSVTSWSPREARRKLRRGWRIDDEAVGSLVVAAAVEQIATLVGLAAVVVGSSAVLLDVVIRRPTISVQLLLVAAAVALAFTARAYRRRRDRLLLRWAAAAPLLTVSVPWMAHLGGSGAVATTVLLLALGLALTALSGPVGAGYRSLWAARLADMLESLAMVSAFPLAIWACGLVDWAMGLLG